jgi:hypothetical protein
MDGKKKTAWIGARIENDPSFSFVHILFLRKKKRKVLTQYLPLGLTTSIVVVVFALMITPPIAYK